MKNVLQFDIKTNTSQKGYMHGFQGFANIVKKLIWNYQKKIVSELDAWAVDVDYNSTIPLIEQINSKMISAIKRIQGPVLNLMHLYEMQDISSFCGTIESISDICSIYYTMSKQKDMKLGNIKKTWRWTRKKQRGNDEMFKKFSIRFKY